MTTDRDIKPPEPDDEAPIPPCIERLRERHARQEADAVRSALHETVQKTAVDIADALRAEVARTVSGWQADAVKWKDERDALTARAERAEAEAAALRARFDRLIQVLVGIHSLTYPAPVQAPDGKTYVFRPEDPHTQLQALSDRIRDIPGEIDAARAREGGNG